MADVTLTVKVTGMDFAAWAIDYGIDAEAAPADFRQMASDQLQGSLDELLHRMGYHDQTVTVE